MRPARIPSVALLLAIALPLSLRASAQDRPGEKAPVPAEASQKDAEKKIREIFRDEYARTGPEARKDLARHLLRQAGLVVDDPVSQYVFLREARDLASQVGDLEIALQAVDEMDRLFAIDALSMKGSLLMAAARSAQSVDAAVRLAEALLRLADDAEAAGEFGTAEKAAAAAVSTSRTAQNALLATRAETRTKRISELKGRFAEIKNSIRALADNPDDPAANLQVGQFLSLGRGDWRRGLLHLKKGDDEAFKSAAEADLAAPTEAPRQVEVGEAWWNLAGKQSGISKLNILRRANFWYVQAFPRLQGLTRTKTRRRLEDIRAAEDARRTWVDITDATLFNAEGKPGQPVTFSTPKGMRTGYTVWYARKKPEGIFDGFSARVRLGRNEGVEELYGGPVWSHSNRGGELLARVTESQTFAVGPRWTDNRFDIGPENCEKRDSYVITVTISDGYYVVYLDDQEMGRVSAPGEELVVVGFQALGTMVVDRIRLRRKE